MKEILEILKDLKFSQKSRLLEYLSRLEEDCELLINEQKNLLKELDMLYKRNQQLHQRLEEIEKSPTGNKLTELLEENQNLRLQLQQSTNILTKVASLLDI